MIKNKAAIITGASRGIGKAIAIALANEGARVVVNYSSSEAEAQEIVKTITDAGGEAIAFKASVDNEADVNAMFAITEEKFGGVDILVNNAGITKDGLLFKMKNEDWDKVISTNLTGAFFCSRLALKPMMKKRYGKIINVSSAVAFSGNVGQFNYCAAKAGMIGMTKSLALEMASRGIRVNAIAPGFIETDMTAKLSEEFRKTFADQRIPLKYLGKPEDIAAAAVYLASPASDYMTGQTLHINGGLYI